MWRATLLCPALYFLAGCAGSDNSLANVTGRVTFYGLPADAEVIFEPQESDGSANGRPATAFTDDNGYFTLYLTAEDEGVTIGRHQVSIKIFRWKNGGEVELFGAGVAAIKTARLIRQVRPGKNHFDFLIGY